VFFDRRAKVKVSDPTAMQSVALGHDTPDRTFPQFIHAGGFGVATIDHDGVAPTGEPKPITVAPASTTTTVTATIPRPPRLTAP